MDFHSLSRKELQTLCKLNKIPANLTNVAMADALSALHKVEGLEALINGVESASGKSPEKMVPECPKTACRTTTLRKQVDVESLPVVSTRRKTRRSAAVEADQENMNANHLVTPAAYDTKARRMATTFGSTSQKSVAREEQSVQRGRGARLSVRLLEKSLREMSLKEEQKVEPVKFDVSESNKVSDEILDRIDELGGFSSQNQSRYNGNDYEDKLPEDSKESEKETKICSVKLDFGGDDNSASFSGVDAKEVDYENCNKRNDIEADPSTGENKEALSNATISEMSNEVNNNDALLVVEMVSDDIAASAQEAKNAKPTASPNEDLSSPNKIKEYQNLQGLVGDESEINSILEKQHGNPEEGFYFKQLEEVQKNETQESAQEEVLLPSETVLSEKLASKTEPEDPKANIEDTLVLENPVSEASDNLEKIPEEEMIVPSIFATHQDQFHCPTVSTPVKSLAEKDSALPTVNHVSEIDDEQNIHISGMKLEPKQDVLNIIADEEMLGRLSIRQLTKMVKELQISKNKKEKHTNKAAKARLPLQRLQENRIATTESGHEF